VNRPTASACANTTLRFKATWTSPPAAPGTKAVAETASPRPLVHHAQGSRSPLGASPASWCTTADARNPGGSDQVRGGLRQRGAPRARLKLRVRSGALSRAGHGPNKPRGVHPSQPSGSPSLLVHHQLPFRCLPGAPQPMLKLRVRPGAPG
jgi:hypothetical protein